MNEDSYGWIKLHRSLLSWEWWDDVNTTRLFIYCLLKANAEDKSWHGQMIKRGTFVTSVDSLVVGTRLTIQQVRTSLNKLKTTGEITSKSTNKNTTITICNYEKYQLREDSYQQTNQQIVQQANNKQITNEQQTNNNNEEYKKERIKENISSSTREDVEIDFQKLMAYWNDRTKGVFLPVEDLTGNLERRMRTQELVNMVGKVKFMECIEKCIKSEFLKTKGSAWCRYDWMILKKNFDDIMNGKYDGPINKSNDDGKPKSNVERRLRVTRTTGPASFDFK